MWPFSKKPEEPKIDYVDMMKKRRENEIKDLQEKFKLGDSFDYLGVSCLVTKTVESYADHIFLDCIGAFPTVSYRAKLYADYVDKNGVVRELALSYPEAMRLDIAKRNAKRANGNYQPIRTIEGSGLRVSIALLKCAAL